MAVHARGGLKMAKGLRVRDMFPAACACGIGFTVSFLIASLAYTNTELSAEGRFGVLMAPDRGAHQRHPPEPSVQAVREGGAGVGVVTELLLVCWRHPRQGVRDHVENGCVEEKRQEKEAA